MQGRTFGHWVRDSGVRAGEQMRVWSEPGGRVLLCRVQVAEQVRLVVLFLG